MSNKNSAQNVIQSYRKKQQMGPFLIGGLAVLLVVIGIIVLVVWLTSGSAKSGISLFASATPTMTSTYTSTPVTPTLTYTSSPTPSETPTVTLTPTANAPFEYIVQEGDTCYGVAEKYNVDVLVLMALNNLDSSCLIKPGDKIFVPAPGQQLDTATPIPTGQRGEINYVVQTGDTLAIIAAKFNSTVDQIMTRNKLTDANVISVGQTLIVPVNIATPVPTSGPTRTVTPGGPTPTATTAAVATSGPTPTATKQP